MVTVSHNGALLTAVQLHPSGELTDVEPVVPAAATVAPGGDSEYVHGAGAWSTTNVCPPIVSVACRGSARVFAAAENETVPAPDPLDPAVTVSHEVALLTAVHEHPAGALTAVDPDPPDAWMDALAGDKEVVQVTPDCVTVKVHPAIVSVPTRPDDDRLALTL